MQEPCSRACHTASEKELPALVRVRSPGEAEAFQLSERETLSKVESVPHFLAQVGEGCPPPAGSRTE